MTQLAAVQIEFEFVELRTDAGTRPQQLPFPVLFQQSQILRLRLRIIEPVQNAEFSASALLQKRIELLLDRSGIAAASSGSNAATMLRLTGGFNARFRCASARL